MSPVPGKRNPLRQSQDGPGPARSTQQALHLVHKTWFELTTCSNFRYKLSRNESPVQKSLILARRYEHRSYFVHFSINSLCFWLISSKIVFYPFPHLCHAVFLPWSSLFLAKCVPQESASRHCLIINAYRRFLDRWLSSLACRLRNLSLELISLDPLVQHLICFMPIEATSPPPRSLIPIFLSLMLWFNVLIDFLSSDCALAVLEIIRHASSSEPLWTRWWNFFQKFELSA